MTTLWRTDAAGFDVAGDRLRVILKVRKRRGRRWLSVVAEWAIRHRGGWQMCAAES